MKRMWAQAWEGCAQGWAYKKGVAADRRWSPLQWRSGLGGGHAGRVHEDKTTGAAYVASGVWRA